MTPELSEKVVQTLLDQIDDLKSQLAAAGGAPAAAAAASPAAAAQKILRINDVAPNFQAGSSTGAFDLHNYFGSSWGILFSHPVRVFLSPGCRRRVLVLRPDAPDCSYLA